jgi:hypothetical protein
MIPLDKIVYIPYKKVTINFDIYWLNIILNFFFIFENYILEKYFRWKLVGYSIIIGFDGS